VFINPGNPTGQCLSYGDVKNLIQFCIREKLVLFADEVYQENVYIEQPFVSARKVLHDMGAPHSSALELCSFHTASKGAWGECGLRGGYFEMLNVDPRTVDEIYKLASVNLSPNTPGQVAMGIMTNPPVPGDASYPLFKAEKEERIASLGRRARMITDGFNACEGIVCQPCQGAMYSFPKLTLPPAAMAAAFAASVEPDVFYCLALLDATGISTTPGSGFGQAPGTFHLRTTILPPEENIAKLMADFQAFHKQFMCKYRSGGDSLTSML
jgi:glutamate--glyoxylate aminotransferase